MLLALLAAGVTVLPAAHRAPSVDQRLALMEAKQMLESQQLWSLQSQLPPEALKAIDNVELHVQHDQEQEEQIHLLVGTVQQLEQRLAALELLLQDHGVESARVPVAPMQVPPVEVAAKLRKPGTARAPHKPAKSPHATRPHTRVAETP